MIGQSVIGSVGLGMILADSSWTALFVAVSPLASGSLLSLSRSLTSLVNSLSGYRIRYYNGLAGPGTYAVRFLQGRRPRRKHRRRQRPRRYSTGCASTNRAGACSSATPKCT